MPALEKLNELNVRVELKELGNTVFAICSDDDDCIGEPVPSNQFTLTETLEDTLTTQTSLYSTPNVGSLIADTVTGNTSIKGNLI